MYIDIHIYIKCISLIIIYFVIIANETMSNVFNTSEQQNMISWTIDPSIGGKFLISNNVMKFYI